jgi:hypothetical protein
VHVARKPKLPSTPERPSKEALPLQAVVILGQSLNPDGSAPGTLPTRAEAGAAAYKACLRKSGKALVIASGGDPMKVGKSEAALMADMLRSHGVPSSAIVLEEQSLNTMQNAWFSLPLLPGSCWELTLVTSEFHMPRASYIFEAVQKHLGRTSDIALRRWAASGGCARPASDGAALQSGINQKTLVERLRDEAVFVRHEMEQVNLVKHIPGVEVEVLSAERLSQAISEVQELLKEAEAKETL